MKPLHHVESVAVLKQGHLRLTFDDGFVGDVDLSTTLPKGEAFAPLADPAFFATVYVDPVSRTVTWPGDIDLDPCSLYDAASTNPVAAT